MADDDKTTLFPRPADPMRLVPCPHHAGLADGLREVSAGLVQLREAIVQSHSDNTHALQAQAETLTAMRADLQQHETSEPRRMSSAVRRHAVTVTAILGVLGLLVGVYNMRAAAAADVHTGQIAVESARTICGAERLSTGQLVLDVSRQTADDTLAKFKAWQAEREAAEPMRVKIER